VSIESKHGMDKPDYEPVERRVVRDEDFVDDISHTLGPLETVTAFLIPFAGFLLAIWRFGRGDIGPGMADLMIGAVGFVVAVALLSGSL
jgi:hypothetical protein